MNLTATKKKGIVVMLSLITTNVATYYYSTFKAASTAETSPEQTSAAYTDHCAVKVKRLGGYNYINPVLFVDRECESDKLSPIKQSVTTLLDEYKRLGTINSGSLFLKEYAGNEWIGINSDEKYLPGSLLKVPELITYLKMEEANPGTLNKVLTYEKVYEVDKHPKYLSKSIQLGHSYTVRELLDYMIIHSDNSATSLLFAHMDLKMFKKVFTDMGLQAPDLTAQNYPISARDFSIFMRVLYNSSYLTNKNSEYATELLSKCNFTEGLVDGLPSKIKVAHKFGEAGDPNEKQFSESAIVYLNDNPYILTVMVKGKDYSKLPDIIKQISGIVYQNMSGHSS